MNFYATIAYEQIRQFMPGVPYLLPASSWARGMRKDGTLPAPAIPAHIPEVAADSGGFVATKIWGDYRYSPGQFDYWSHCQRCEDEMAVESFFRHPAIFGGDDFETIMDRVQRSHPELFERGVLPGYWVTLMLREL